MATGRDGTAELLLALCRAELSSADAERIRALLNGPVDWRRLSDLAQLHGVVGLVRRNLAALAAQEMVPASAWQALQQAAAQIVFDGMLQLRQLRLVVQALRSADVAPLVLKGAALADLVYGDPLLRPSTDLDLLVRRAELAQACAALEPLGARLPSKGQIDFQLANSYDLAVELPLVAGKPGLVELHWDLAPRGLVTIDLDAWRRRAEVFEVDGITLRRLAPEDMLLHLALHMRKHRYVGLRWLCDVAELVRRSASTSPASGRQPLDWDYIVTTAHSAGFSVLLYVSLALAQRLLAAPVPSEVLATVEPSALRRRLVQDVLTQDLLLQAVEKDEAGWTQRAPMEVWLLDRPSAMARELRYRLLPPAEGPLGAQAATMGAGQRAVFSVRRLASRSATLLRR